MSADTHGKVADKCVTGSPTVNSQGYFDVTAELIDLLRPFEVRKPKGGVDITNRNEGDISFSNMAVWLVVYQMLSETEKNACIKAIKEKSGKNPSPHLLSMLNNTNIIKQLIENCGTEGIEIKVNSSAINAGCLNNLQTDLLEWLKERNYILSSADLRKVPNPVDDGDKYLSVKMKKEISYQWNDSGYPLEFSNGHFCDETKGYKDFLEFSRDTYNASILQYANRKWLVVEKPTYGRSPVISQRKLYNTMENIYGTAEQQGRAIFFTPVLNDEELNNVARVSRESMGSTGSHKQSLCSKILHGISTHKLYMEFKKQSKTLTLSDCQTLSTLSTSLLKNNLLVEERVEYKPNQSFPLDVCVFPNLNDQWVGTKIEMSIDGPYEPTMFAPLFANGKAINGAHFAEVFLKCVFAIKYDEVGGEIKNEVSICCTDGMPNFNHKAYKITLGQPFILCYQTEKQNNAQDLYSFKICNPYKRQDFLTNIGNDGTELVPDLEDPDEMHS